MSDFVWQPGQMIVFAGDSITDCGRRGESAPYGNGYVRQTIDLIAARYPAHGLSYFNAGISGNTVADLRERWGDDVLYHKPDWVTVKIGINDIHRTLAELPTAVPVDMYEEKYREILTRTRDSGARLVLIDPFYISQETQTGTHRRKVLDTLPSYLDVVERLATEFEALHVRTHQLFVEQLKHRPSDTMCPEPVHPNATGHLVIAQGLLEKLNW